jgi:hypothetical protein
MMIRALVLYFILLSSLLAVAKDSMKEVYSGKIPVSGSYGIKLEVPKDWTDPGDYTKATITFDGKTLFSLKDLQASSLVNVGEFPSGTKSMGKYLKVFPAGVKSKSQFILALSNWIGGSGDDELILVSLKENTAKLSFRESTKIAAIKDFDGDGYFDLLKTGGRGEPTAENNYSYDPFLVYLQVQSGNKIKFKLDEALSKKWSEENNFHWHGMKYDEKIRVDKSGNMASQK